MQRYYRAAKLVRQVNVILLQNLHPRLFPIATEPILVNRRTRGLRGCGPNFSFPPVNVVSTAKPGRAWGPSLLTIPRRRAAVNG